MSVKAVRTPDAAFDGLPVWPYSPNYVEDLPGYEGLRIHYVDTGPGGNDETFLCLHGQPTWAYLYRKMIPVFAEAGARVVAPDWLGFGRSDKPVEDEAYTFEFHRNMMLGLIERLDLRNITLVVQDWGGLLGLTLPMESPDRFARLLVMNTTLATGLSAGKGFDDWRAFCRANPDFDIAGLMQRACPGLSEAEAHAYGAPFPGSEFRAGVRRFPEMVMTAPDMDGVDISKRAVRFFKEDWQGDSFVAVGMQDPVLGPRVMASLRETIRGCPEPLELPQTGHFVQEDGETVARAALEHWAKGGR